MKRAWLFRIDVFVLTTALLLNGCSSATAQAASPHSEGPAQPMGSTPAARNTSPQEVPIGISQDQQYGRPVTILNNGHITTTIDPAIGGRIISFRLHPSPAHTAGETIYINTSNIHYNPDDMWSGVDYGGICDVGMEHWPGPFWGKDYQLTPMKSPREPQVTLATKTDAIGIHRTVTLLPETTIMQVRTLQSNLRDHATSMTVRLHGEFAVGQCGDNSDTIIFKKDGQLVKLPYRLGWENPRFSWETPSENWIAILDATEQLALVRHFHPGNEPIRLLYWRGHNEGAFVRDECGGFYAIDRYYDAGSILPNQAAETREDYFIIYGLTRIDFVHDTIVGGITINQETFGPGQSAQLTVTIGAATANGPYQLAWQSSDGKTRGTDTLPAHEIGRTAETTLALPLTKTTELTLSVSDRHGEQLAEITRTLTVDPKGYRTAVDAVDQAKAALNTIDQQLQTNAAIDPAVRDSQRALAELTIAPLTTAFENGRFDTVATLAPEVISQLAKQSHYLDQLAPASPGQQQRIDTLLKQLTHPE